MNHLKILMDMILVVYFYFYKFNYRKDRIWYKLSKLNQYNNICSLTSDYIDQKTKLRIATFSKPLIDSKGNFFGVIGLDFVLEKFQNFFDEVLKLFLKLLIIKD